MMPALAQLEATIRERARADADTSYVAGLLRAGPARIARKLGEEAIECVIAAIDGSDAELAGEAADLVFHLTVLLHARGLSLADVDAELARRAGVSGLAEKASRKG